MNGHLVAVKIGIESRADQWVKLYGLTFHKHWLEGLDAKTVQRRRAVEHHWVLADNFFKNIPDFRSFFLDHTLSCLDGVGQTV